MAIPPIGSGTPKPLWPTQAKQILLTNFLRAKLFLKLPQAQGLFCIQLFILSFGARAMIVNLLKKVKIGGTGVAPM
jgi:hypothetical protein